MHGKLAAGLLTVGIALSVAGPAQAQAGPHTQSRQATTSVEVLDPAGTQTATKPKPRRKRPHRGGHGGEVTTTYDLHQDRERVSGSARASSAGPLASALAQGRAPLSNTFENVLISGWN